jgi:hypothetical protein
MIVMMPKRLISAGHERRREHGDYVPLNHERGIAKRQQARRHRKRRCGHQQFITP